MGGYATDSDRSYFEEGADAMIIHPVNTLPKDQLVRCRRGTGKAIANPRLASLDRKEPTDTPIIQA